MNPEFIGSQRVKLVAFSLVYLGQMCDNYSKIDRPIRLVFRS